MSEVSVSDRPAKSTATYECELKTARPRFAYSRAMYTGEGRLVGRLTIWWP